MRRMWRKYLGRGQGDQCWVFASSLGSWVRAKEDLIGLNTSENFNRWVRQDLRFFARVYLELLDASETLRPGLELVRFNADHGFTQQFQVLLAPLLRAYPEFCGRGIS